MDVGKEEVHLWQPQCHAYRDSDMAHFPSRETPVNSLTRTFGLLPEHITKTQFVPAWNTGRASDGSIVVHGIRKPGRREDGVILRGGRWWGCEGGADWPVMVMTIDGGVRVRALQWVWRTWCMIRSAFVHRQRRLDSRTGLLANGLAQ